jgi:hypothetical protein
MQPAKAFLGVGDVVTDPGLTGQTIAAEAARAGQTITMIQNQFQQIQNAITNTLFDHELHDGGFWFWRRRGRGFSPPWRIQSRWRRHELRPPSWTPAECKRFVFRLWIECNKYGFRFIF